MTLDEAYTALSDILDREKHDPECAWRCLVPECGQDHWCVACDEPINAWINAWLDAHPLVGAAYGAKGARRTDERHRDRHHRCG